MKIVRALKNELRALREWIVMYFPRSSMGYRLRLKYWGGQLNNKSIAYIGQAAYIGECDLVRLGEHFMLGDNAVITVADSDPVYIGNNVAISEGSYLRSANHGTNDWSTPIILQGHTSKKIPYKESTYSIVIEDDVWIASHCVVLTGALIGKGSLISAGSVVSSEIPPYSIVVGNPARVIANRKKLSQMTQNAGGVHAKI